MQHSAIVKKNENITIFTYTNLEDPYINVWKLDETGNFNLLIDCSNSILLTAESSSIIVELFAFIPSIFVFENITFPDTADLTW